jgi:hypothetical protein
MHYGVCSCSILTIFDELIVSTDRVLRKEAYDLLQFKTKNDALATAPFTDEMMELLRKVRENKRVNKQRERTREMRGEVLPITLRRRRQGKPAHMLPYMTQQQFEDDKAMRNVSKVGYVGVLKEKYGYKGIQKGENWDIELGYKVTPEQNERMDQVLEEIRQENARRRGPDSKDSSSQP